MQHNKLDVYNKPIAIWNTQMRAVDDVTIGSSHI